MNNWKEKALGEIITLKRGYDLPKQDRQDGLYPVVSSSGISGHHCEAKVNAPGVVTGRYGTLGVVYYILEDFWPLNTTLYVKDFKGNDPRFVSYFLQCLNFQAFSDKSSVPGLNRNHLHSEYVRVPLDVDEQRAIAHILGTLDDKIELNRGMNETLEATARAIFKSWFVDFDPVRAKLDGQKPVGMDDETAALFPDRIEDCEIGGIPHGWRAIPLYDTAEFVNGAAFRSEHFCDSSDGLPIIKIAELKKGITSQTKYTNRNDLAEKYEIVTGDLLYSWSGSPDTSLDTFLWTKGNGWLNQHIFKVVTSTNANKVFVYYLLKHLRSTLIEVARNKQTTGLGHVTVSDMKRLLVPFPTPEVLAAFELQAGPFFHLMFEHNLQNESLATIRDTLLPKLLSGEIRLADIQRITGRSI